MNRYAENKYSLFLELKPVVKYNKLSSLLNETECNRFIEESERIRNTMNSKTAEIIREIVADMMNRVMDKVLVSDPFIPEQHHASKPLYATLVPDEIFKGAHFERRFVTPFGSVWEKLAVAVASGHHGHCEQGRDIVGNIGREASPHSRGAEQAGTQYERQRKEKA